MSPGVGETLNLRHGAFTSRPEKTLLKSFFGIRTVSCTRNVYKSVLWSTISRLHRTVSSVFTLEITSERRHKATRLAQHGGPRG